jgi:hypothetical protein
MMVTSVTPMVCITLAFWLGRGKRSACADTHAAVQKQKHYE